MKHDRGKATPAPRGVIETREHFSDHIVMLTTRSIPFSFTAVPRFLYLLPSNDLHRLCGLAVAGYRCLAGFVRW